VGEPLIRTRPHTAVLARPLALAIAAAALLALVVAVLRSVSHPGILGQLAALVATVLAVLAIVGLLRRVWEWDRTLLVVDAERVVVVHGGIRRSEQIVPLAGVQRLRVRRTIGGRLLGYGTIELAGSGRGSRLAYVPEPDAVSEVIGLYAGRRRPGA
jgi:membrane protein YdbS with pleckstrin-like domain